MCSSKPCPERRVRDVLHCVQGQTEAARMSDHIEGEHRALGPYRTGPSPTERTFAGALRDVSPTFLE